MTEVDTSSYPKPQPAPNALDTIGKLQGLEQNQIGIDANKLKLVNERWAVTNRELQGLIGDKDVDFNKVAGRFQNLVNLGLMPPEMMAQSLKDVPTDKAKIPEWLQMRYQQGQHIVDSLNYGQGQPNTRDLGNGYQPTRESSKPGIGIRSDGPPIRKGLAPENQQFDTDPNSPTYGQKTYGATAATPPGMATTFPPMNAPVDTSPLPVGRRSLPDGSTMDVGPNTAPQAQAPLPVARPPAPNSVTSMPPLFEEGKKAYTDDQTLATQKLTDIKPAIKALELVKGLRSGPGTETWNKAVAFGKANGILPITANDPTAIYQEANKYFNQYVQKSGSRSDADLAQREVSNPSISQQIQPALEKLTRSQIARDRIEAARSGAFSETDENGKVRMRNDFDKYGQHRSTFPPKMDEKAFTIDTLEPEEKQKLLGEMTKKAKAGDKQAVKFFKSLEVAKRTGVFQ